MSSIPFETGITREADRERNELEALARSESCAVASPLADEYLKQKHIRFGFLLIYTRLVRYD